MAQSGPQVKKRILIADDNPQILDLLEELLTSEGFEIHRAEDGKKALGHAARVQPQLILLDVNMPKIDGFEVLKRLKKDKKTAAIPVIMLTFRQEMTDIVRGLSSLADKYIPKPFDTKVLVREVQETLSRQQPG